MIDVTDVTGHVTVPRDLSAGVTILGRMASTASKSLLDVAKESQLKTSQESAPEPTGKKLTLLDVAAAQPPDATKPTTSLIDFAKNENKPTLMSIAEQPKPTLASVAANSKKSLVEAVQETTSTAPSLVEIAKDLREDKASSFGKQGSLVEIAAQVDKEKSAEIQTALKASTVEVKKEKDAVAAATLNQAVTEVKADLTEVTPENVKKTLLEAAKQVKVEKEIQKKETAVLKECAKQVAASKPASNYSEDDYDADEFEDNKKKTQEVDNQSEAESACSIERTCPSSDKASKEFLLAVYRGKMNKVRDMLEKGDVEANATDQHGWNGLHWAASQGHGDIVKYLIKAGVSVNAVEPIHLWSPLHLAVIRTHVSTVKLLLHHGANKQQADIYGDRPMDCMLNLKGTRRKQMLDVFDAQDTV